MQTHYITSANTTYDGTAFQIALSGEEIINLSNLMEGTYEIVAYLELTSSNGANRMSNFIPIEFSNIISITLENERTIDDKTVTYEINISTETKNAIISVNIKENEQ